MKKILCFVIISFSLFAANGNGSRGSKRLFFIPTANTLKFGQFIFIPSIDFYTIRRSVDGNSKLYWQANAGFGLSYGISRNLDASLFLQLYQDTQEKRPNVPSYVDLDIKWGNINLASDVFIFSWTFGGLYHLGEFTNLPFTDYISKGTTAKTGFTFSYYTDRFLRENSFSVHLNAGLAYHFDEGNLIRQVDDDDLFSGLTTTKLNVGLGLNVPTSLFDIMFEVDGYTFIRTPAKRVYSREDIVRTRFVVRYKIDPLYSFDFGLGFKIGEGKESTVIPGDVTPDKIDEYSGMAPWRAFIAMNISLQARKAYDLSEYEIERNRYQRKVQIFLNLLEEREKSENIEDELKILKKEREDAEKELEKLKNSLNDL